MKKRKSYDSVEGLSFFLSQLTYLEKKLYEKKYKDITYPMVLPVSNEAGEWAESVTYFYMDGAAIAEFVGTKSLNVPIAEIGEENVVVPVELGATGYEYSDEELRQAQFLQRPLPDRKAMIARRAYEELAQRTAMFGNETHNLPGFLNNVNVTTSTAVNPGSGTEWVNKTPDQIIFDINDMLGSIFVDSLQVERPDTLLIPTKQYNYIANTPRSSTSDTTILQYLVANNIYINSDSDIMPLPELAGSGSGDSDRMMAYTKDIDKVVYHIPMPLRFTQPERRGRGYQVPGEFKLAGIEFRYPGSARYVDGI